jgi:5'-deoxynucleotidase YfbR-like HD superfamily hydrolase
VLIPLANGSRLIADIMNPKASELDMDFIAEKLRHIKRFSGHPRALNIEQHHLVVYKLEVMDRSGYVDDEDRAESLDWGLNHDRHEGLIGDTISPVKKVIAMHTPILKVLERGIDEAICENLGIPYPSLRIKAIVRHYDKIAESIEWVHALRNEPADWNYPIPDWLSYPEASRLIDWALAQ